MQIILRHFLGKTLFLFWLMTERLLDGKPTIFQTKKDEYAYFSAEGFRRLSDRELKRIDNTWLLVDMQYSTGPPPMKRNVPFTIFTTSPLEKVYKQWMKQVSARMVIMNPWEWEELNFVGYVHSSMMWFLA
jgi:hypothetical protein